MAKNQRRPDMLRFLRQLTLIIGTSWMIGTAGHASSKEACIYYDTGADPTYRTGQIYAIMLQNLLGHFRSWETRSFPVSTYFKGDIDRCDATFYLGTHFDSKIPQAFIQDFKEAKSPAVWMGYSIWKFSDSELASLFGYRYSEISGLNWQIRDQFGAPTFYKHILYLGETFWKTGFLRNGQFVGAHELIRLEKLDGRAEVLAHAFHNGTGEVIPYALRSRNRFYIADVPFSYMHEDDRYLIFADLLFDVLDESPLHPQKKPAVFRIEDVNLASNHSRLERLSSWLQEWGVPFHIALVPIFSDPNNASGMDWETPIGMSQDPAFVSLLHTLRKRGASFIWHGVTHQYESMNNPVNAMTGDDFEFWDIVNQKPIPEDSPEHVLKRLDWGWRELERAGIHPQIWEVPHYWASALDYTIFARVFPWNIGRIMYSLNETKGLPKRFSSKLTYPESGMAGSKARLRAFRKLEVQATSEPVGQILPYEIFKDAYGQRVFPENLGNVQPDGIFGKSRSTEEILNSVRRNRVLRDVWASFFIHPFLLDTEHLSREKLKHMVQEIRANGYEFVDLEKMVKEPR